ncbi:hypothetical protein HK100_007246 [Physocladia obscura]|uniref:Endonuclease/exonuclease/phosphatase domain-containing protein n=1 Tax=Physocladia obscura TaxID=109957 RepID=A0AAD5SPS2_9FUNG|nr:hypothetical protein HK100_007246 [Physocladia obscura]
MEILRVIGFFLLATLLSTLETVNASNLNDGTQQVLVAETVSEQASFGQQEQPQQVPTQQQQQVPTQQQQQPPTKHELSILTQNCKLLLVVGEWPVMPVSASARARRIADRLVANAYDIIGLNEVFLKDSTAIVKSVLESNGYNVITNFPESLPSVIKFVNSGLLLASRRPIIAHHFERYTQSSGMDVFATKGILVAELGNTNSSESTATAKTTASRIFVAISHLQSEGSDDIMESQFIHVGAVIQKFVLDRVQDDDELRASTVLVFGDMNVIEQNTPHLYESLLKNLSKDTVDLYVRANGEGNGGATFPVDNPVERLDYVFSLTEFEGRPGVKLGGSEVLSVAVDKLIVQDSDIALSDHLGVVANIALL